MHSHAAETTDVLVIGGGVLGASVLHELAALGVQGLLLERGAFASESTGKSAAIVRTNYSNPAVVRMAVRSRDVFRGFEELMGSESVYYECGWVYLVPDEDVSRIAGVIEMNRAEGVVVESLDVAAATELLPGLSTEGVAQMYLEPLSGCAAPAATTRGYMAAARRRGAIAREGVEVTGLVTRGDRVVGAETTHGRVEAGTVVLAAGPWSARLAATIGLELPYQITREEELYLQVSLARRPRAVLSSVVDRIYVRPLFELDRENAGGMIVGRGFPKEYEQCDPDSYDENLSSRFEADVRQRLVARLPELDGAERVGGVVGLYAATPDWHPYLGPVAGYDGLVLATGGSGHCFKLAPAIGEMVAGAITGRAPDYADVNAFDLGRFARQETFGAAIGGNRA